MRGILSSPELDRSDAERNGNRRISDLSSGPVAPSIVALIFRDSGIYSLISLPSAATPGMATGEFDES